MLVVAVRLERIPVPVRMKVMVSPSATALPFASITIALTVLVLEPSAVRLLGEAVSVIPAATSGIKVTDVLAEMPPALIVMVAEPTFVGLVSFAVAVPFVVVVTSLSVPAVATKVTVVLSGMLLPAASFTVAVIVVDEPFATIPAEPAPAVTEPTTASINVMAAGMEAVTRAEAHVRSSM